MEIKLNYHASQVQLWKQKMPKKEKKKSNYQ